VDTDLFRPAADDEERRSAREWLGLPGDRPLVLFVGRLVPKKGYRTLVEVARRQDRWTAVLVGNGTLGSDEQHPCVRHLGSFEQRELALAYRAADVFALPSQAEGFPLTVQEAMASGLPIVTTDDAGYDMYRLDRSMMRLVNPDEAEVGAAIEEVLADSRALREMGEYSRATALDQFSWARHVQELAGGWEPAIAAARQGPGTAGRLSLLRNAAALLATTGTTALLGLLFWTLAARLFSVHDVGIATSVIAGVSLLSYLSMFGLASGLVRFLPTARDPASAVSTSLTVVGGVGLLLGVGYGVILPVIGGQAALVFHGPIAVAAIGVAAAFAAVNLITDSVFIAGRAAHWNIVVDGVLQGGVKIITVCSVAGLGVYGLFGASAVGSFVAATASLVLLRRRLKLHLRPRLRIGDLRGYFSFSASSYVASLLNLAPLLVMPVIALDELGAKDAGWYYLAYQVAALMFAIPFSVCESLFAEASHRPHEVARLTRTSIRAITLTLVPASLFVIALAPLLLDVFGASYGAHAAALLRVFALSAIPVAANTLTSFLLKIRVRMSWLVWSNVAYAAIAVGGAVALAGHGLAAMGWAWLAANSVSALIAIVGLARTGKEGASCASSS
jgi:O-antigen/teichoic acid export membrane protein